MATRLRPTPDERLAELEAIQRPLTDEESEELRRVIHAIYMRHWRAELAEREMHLAAAKENRVEPPKFDGSISASIADRMIAARDKAWLPLKSDSWQDDAREASDQLRDAILALQAREMVAA